MGGIGLGLESWDPRNSSCRIVVLDTEVVDSHRFVPYLKKSIDWMEVKDHQEVLALH